MPRYINYFIRRVVSTVANDFFIKLLDATRHYYNMSSRWTLDECSHRVTIETRKLNCLIITLLLAYFRDNVQSQEALLKRKNDEIMIVSAVIWNMFRAEQY